MAKKYRITVTKSQAEVINKALELYSRVGMGQLDRVLDHHELRMSVDECHIASSILQELKVLCTKKPVNSYFSISSKEIDDSYRVAWDIQQTIRHRLAWDENPRGGIFVQFDEPFKTSTTESLPLVESSD